MARLLVTVIADDLSGAADSAVPFAAAGLATWVFLDRDPGEGDVAVAAVDTDSRAEGIDVAVARTRAAAAAAFGAASRVLYKKMDSTLRGHVGPEVAAAFAAALEASPGGVRPIVLMSPAFPATGRTVRSGRVFVDGVPLEAAPAALLAAAGLAVAGVPSATEMGGAAPLAAAIEHLAASTVDAIVCDAASEADLSAVAEAGAGLSRPVLWAGSGGLARHLPRALGLGADVRSAEVGSVTAAASSGPTLVLVGSRTAIALRQAAALARGEMVEAIAISPAALFAGEDDAGWRDTAARIDRALGAGRDAAVVIAPEGAIVDGVERGLAVAMGRLAATRPPIGALVATGGDTARAALRARGIEGYRLVGELEPGVPLGIAPPAAARASLRIVTKAGGFGTPETLVRCCASLRAAGTRSLSA